MRYARPQRDPVSRVIGIVAVVLLHVGLVYALLNGLGQQAIQVVMQQSETTVIDEVKPQDKPPPPPPPKLQPPPPPFIPMPDFQIKTAPTQSVNAITQFSNQKPVDKALPPPVERPAGPVIVAPVVDARNCSKPEYPSVSKRLGEEGRVVLLFLIDINGRAIESQIKESSGHPRLDEAARQALSLCKFKPGTIDGKIEQVWMPLVYKFELSDQ